MDLVAPLLIFDNGASSIKHAVLHPSETQAPSPSICSNSLTRSKLFPKRTFIGSQLERECDDFAGLTYRLPFEKGILRDWEVQKEIWDWVIKEGKISPEETDLLLTEPPLDLPNVQESYDQMIFEEYEFQSYIRAPAALFSGWYPTPIYGFPEQFQTPAEPKKKGKRKSRVSQAASQVNTQQSQRMPECTLVVDAGYSFTHIVPVVQGRVIGRGVRRIDVGGKLLTNHLKELVSFRQWYMMDQTYVMNVVKERCCFVSPNFPAQLRSWRSNPSSIVQQYVLPDFTPSQTKDEKTSLGYILQPGEKPMNFLGSEKPDQVLIMGNERFSVPEVLFNPEIIGLDQMGLSDCVADVIESMPEEYRAMFWDNIILTGGSCNFPGFRDRLLNDLRPLAPSEYDVTVHLPPNPITTAFDSASSLLLSSSAPSLLQSFVTKEEYSEWGSNICYRRFGRISGLGWVREFQHSSSPSTSSPINLVNLDNQSTSKSKSSLKSNSTNLQMTDIITTTIGTGIGAGIGVTDDDDETIKMDNKDQDTQQITQDQIMEKELEIFDQFIDATEKALQKTRQGRMLNDDQVLDWEKDLTEKSSSSDEPSDVGQTQNKKRRKTGGGGSSKKSSKSRKR